MSFSEIIDITKWRLSRLFPKKARRVWMFLFCLGVIALINKNSVLRGVGNFLISEDKLEQSDAIFVLGGNTFDRSNQAATLYDQGWADWVITLGANSATVLKSLDEEMPDALVSREQIMEMGVPDVFVIPLIEGTSTHEEAEAILAYSKKKAYKKIIVVSDRFHTRRISYVFDDLFAEAGIEVLLSGSPHSEYEESLWWQEEQGLLMVNNEYVKLVYYWLKY